MYYYLIISKGFPCSSVGKEPACNPGDPSLVPEPGRSAGEGIGYPLQYSGLENSGSHKELDTTVSNPCVMSSGYVILLNVVPCSFLVLVLTTKEKEGKKTVS